MDVTRTQREITLLVATAGVEKHDDVNMVKLELKRFSLYFKSIVSA